jgi:hypothetical protein
MDPVPIIIISTNNEGNDNDEYASLREPTLLTHSSFAVGRTNDGYGAKATKADAADVSFTPSSSSDDDNVATTTQGYQIAYNNETHTVPQEDVNSDTVSIPVVTASKDHQHHHVETKRLLRQLLLTTTNAADDNNTVITPPPSSPYSSASSVVSRSRSFLPSPSPSLVGKTKTKTENNNTISFIAERPTVTPIADKILQEKYSTSKNKISWYNKHGNYIDDPLNNEKYKNEEQKHINGILNSPITDGNKDKNANNKNNINNGTCNINMKRSVENIYHVELKKKMKISDFILYSGGKGSNLKHFQEHYWSDQQRQSSTMMSPIGALSTTTPKEASVAAVISFSSPLQDIQRIQQQQQQQQHDIQQYIYKQRLQQQKELLQFLLQNQQKKKYELHQQQHQLIIQYLQQKKQLHKQLQKQHQHHQHHQYEQQAQQQQQQQSLYTRNSNSSKNLKQMIQKRKHKLFRIKRERDKLNK